MPPTQESILRAGGGWKFLIPHSSFLIHLGYTTDHGVSIQTHNRPRKGMIMDSNEPRVIDIGKFRPGKPPVLLGIFV